MAYQCERKDTVNRSCKCKCECRTSVSIKISRGSSVFTWSRIYPMGPLLKGTALEVRLIEFMLTVEERPRVSVPPDVRLRPNVFTG